MLIICSECKAEISDKADKCPKCGAPLPDWTDKLPESVQAIIGFLIIGAIIFGLIWYFFLKSEIEITDQNIHFGFISDRKISFTAKNSGPAETYNYYVKIGDEFLERLFSPKYCQGTFIMEKNEEKEIKVECPDLNFTFTSYSIVVH